MIAAQKRAGRYNVYVDGKFALAVAESVLIKYRLTRGMEVDAQLLNQLKADDQVAKAYSRMLDFLAHQLRSRQEVVKKLQSQGVNDDDIEMVITKLTDQALINDQEYANAYVRTIMNTELKGPRVIRQKLKEKGIDDQKIDTALQQFTVKQQTENARKLAQKLYRRNQRQPLRRQNEKVIQGLLTNGYDQEIYTAIQDEVQPAADPEQEADLLEQAAQKAWQHYRRDSGYARKMKVKRRLAAKGFSFDDIDHWFSQHDLQD